MIASAINKKPAVYIVFGLPGSGKSYFASRWAAMINARYVNSDKVRKEMYDQPVYSPAEKASVYQQMLVEMRRAIFDGCSVVLDATFSDNSIRRKVNEEASGKAIVHYIEIEAEEDAIRERVKEKRLFSDADYEIYTKLKKQWHGLQDAHLTLHSTSNNINEMLEKAKDHFGIKESP
jgi:predicted kinase